ncbi:MAG: hypothetical protein R2798_04180 [Chitinophagales bacterium]
MNKTLLILLTSFISSLAFSQSNEWHTLYTGAGGWITGMDIHILRESLCFVGQMWGRRIDTIAKPNLG